MGAPNPAARIARAGALAGAAAAAAWSSPALAPIFPPVARLAGFPRRIASSGEVAITFDDGPHPQGTPAVLEALAAGGARATFFLVGEQVERYPGPAAEIVAAGHTVALHGYRHRNMLRLTPAAFAADLDRGLETVGEATGAAPEIYRPPYGIFSPAGPAIVRRRGLRSILWSRWGHDWRGRASAESISLEVSGRLSGGDVLLLHDADHYSAAGSWRATAEAVPRVLAAIDAAGLRPTRL